MRFFHGDSPARQFECGQQKGGNFYCSGCGARAQTIYEFDYCLHCPYMSFSERQHLVMKGPIGRKNSLAQLNHPLHGLTKEQLKEELNAREIYEGDSKKELEVLLVEEMHGVQRVPALLYTDATSTMASHHCENYEILPFEPLHDAGKHIENILNELPSHLTSEEANIVKEVKMLCLGGKETKRTFDYRCTLITLAKNLYKHTTSKYVQLLLHTMVDIQRIAYSSDKDRTPKSVLRLHNMTWYHGILCREVFGFKLKEITTRKLYVNYFHDITTHASMQHRLVCGKSCNVEEQERVFNAIANITKSTSSYQPHHIISNVFVRLQAEKHMSAYKSNCVSTQEASVAKLATSLPPYGNTIIPHHLITKHSRSWQAHLEKISDFLLINNQAWWVEHGNGDIEFYDGEQSLNSHPQGPSLHHFRSSSFTAEENYLKDCWKECLCRCIVLPTKVLRVENEEGNMEIRHLNRSSEANADDHGVEIQPEDATQSDENVVSFKLVTNNDDFNGLHLTSPELDEDCLDIIPVNNAFQKYSNTVNQYVDVEMLT